MQQVFIHDTSDTTLAMLYTELHLRAKEVGELFGVKEDAILLRLRKLGIPKTDRGIKRSEVEVLRTFQVSKRNEITKTLLEDLILQGMTKADIARKFLTSETTITRRMEKFEIVYEEKPLKSLSLADYSRSQLEDDYNEMTKEQFSAKYACSPMVWRPYLDSLGIDKKSERELEPLTREQKVVVLGSMLGDGSVSTGTTFYEYHCKEQEQYLRKKWEVLSNISLDVHPSGDSGGFRFSTRAHPYFKEIYPLFYKDGVAGKHIPLDLLKENWDDNILAIWFLDDGTYDHRTDTVSIANKCPEKRQLDDLVAFLESKYHFHFQVSGSEEKVLGDGIRPTGRVYRVTISKLYHKEFFRIVAGFLPKEMLGKIPQEYIPKEPLAEISRGSGLLHKHPSLFRALTSQEDKEAVVDSYTTELVNNGFPYTCLTNSRLDYLLRQYLAVLPSYKDRITMAKSGYSILEHFFRSQYSAKRKGALSPLEDWSSTSFVRKVALEVLEGSSLSNENEVLRAARKLSRGTVTIQNPSLSAYVYQNFNLNNRALDTSAGFGSRMLSAMSLGLEYHAYEPNTATYSELQNLGNWMLTKGLGGSYMVWCKGSEEKVHSNGYYGLSFTSPPYFDYEGYSTQGTQSVNKHSILLDWLDSYWGKTLVNTAAGLVQGGYMVINLSPRAGDNMILYTEKAAKDLSMGLQDVVRVSYGGRNHGLLKEEWLLVYRKGYTRTYSTLADDLKKFREDNKRDTSKVREVDKEANRERIKQGAIDLVKVKEELLAHVNRGGGYSRESLKNLWEKGEYPLSEPTWVIENTVGSWSEFVSFCGLASNYEKTPLLEQLEGYLEECLRSGNYITHHAYNKAHFDHQNPTKYSSRVKRFLSLHKDFQSLVEDMVQGKRTKASVLNILMN